MPDTNINQMNYHKVLERQVSKLLPETYMEDEHILKFLSTISNSYQTFEKDKKISEHAFNISEHEYQELNKYLRQQNEIKHQSILQLKEAIRSLDQDAIADIDESDDNLIKIISFLQIQIAKSKEIENHLIQAKEFAEKAAMAKSDFLSVMSHEIRTPLNAITGYIHLLQTEDPLPSQVDFLRILKISADNLLSLINDVLDFEKIEGGKIVFAERDIDIRNLVNNIKMANRLRAEENGNTIKVMFDDDIPVYIKGDEVRLTQVLNNLFSNAIKFTHNGKVILEVHLKEINAQQVAVNFAVKDTGIGIAKDKQKMIFDRFTQENSHITRQYGGSGLGLAIIRKLLLLQDSDIYVDSEAGIGSTFYFSLVFGRSKTLRREEKELENVKNDLMSAKILLVEDVEFNVLLAKKILTRWNAEVSLAENGLVAVEKMRTMDYDLVLMDLQMPVMDGLTASMEIRKFNTNTPIIALTASTSMEVQDKVFHSGMTDFISKPLNPSYMYDTILKHLQPKW
jgi:signal transduction histidine kinase/ActR/RegA family two-component response regulator